MPGRRRDGDGGGRFGDGGAGDTAALARARARAVALTACCIAAPATFSSAARRARRDSALAVTKT
jgi:hypothetical protein